jgi:hypothetical protein
MVAAAMLLAAVGCYALLGVCLVGMPSCRCKRGPTDRCVR